MKNRWLRWVAVVSNLSCFAFVLGLSSLTFAKEVQDIQYHFSITIPDEYRQQPIENPDTIYLFANGKPGEPGMKAITIQRLHRTLDRAGKDQAEERKNLKGAQIRTERWQNLGIDVIKTPGNDDANSLYHLADIPLVNEAISITVSGPADQDAQETQLMKELLASLEGVSSWPAEISLLQKWGLPLGIGAAVLLSILFMAAFLKRKNKKKGHP